MAQGELASWRLTVWEHNLLAPHLSPRRAEVYLQLTRHLCLTNR